MKHFSNSSFYMRCRFADAESVDSNILLGCKVTMTDPKGKAGGPLVCNCEKVVTALKEKGLSD